MAIDGPATIDSPVPAPETATTERVADRDLNRLRRAEEQVKQSQQILATAQDNLNRAVENAALWRGARDYAAMEIREYYALTERDVVSDDGAILRAKTD